MKIIDKLNEILASKEQSPFFSFEYFPPKTEAGVGNLYLRMERMTALQPLFVDITWGAGGITKNLTMEISEYAQKYFNVDVLMHLTCTSLTKAEIREILYAAKKGGIQNILALRGDPPKAKQQWEPVPNGFQNAAELVSFIREEFGSYFCIAVAGFPEGHPQSSQDLLTDVRYLRDKVNAGADFVLTQFFYDVSVFRTFLNMARDEGITCPIIPGMMPIQSYTSFQRMTSFCGTKVPDSIWANLHGIRENDEAVKNFGIDLCVKMCNDMASFGVQGFHFYTLNLENSVLSTLAKLGVASTNAAKKILPWRGSRATLRGMEDVRPINWANRPKSYIDRTNNWDDFPNGRWGDGRSPAFGELSNSHFFRPSIGTRQERLEMWGESPLNVEEIYDVFAKFLEGTVPILPWCEVEPQKETMMISTTLVHMNRCGYLTINSQPAVNGARSDDPCFGWGGSDGRVYQKAYVEFFAAPARLEILLKLLNKHPSLSLYAIDFSGTTVSGGSGKGVTALTWGVFPNKEILQPTVFDPNTFEVWSKEAFQLWIDSWASLYDDASDSCDLLYKVHDTYYLIAIVDNDYVESSIFSIFDEALAYEKEMATSSSSSKSDSFEVEENVVL